MSCKTAGECVAGSTKLKRWRGDDEEEDEAGDAIVGGVVENNHWGYE